MKVLTFLEAVRRLVALFDKGGMTKDEFQVRLAKLIEFYSQSFKPEMITEYFEGWQQKEIQRLSVDTEDTEYYFLGKSIISLHTMLDLLIIV